jgi:hypothetical protein
MIMTHNAAGQGLSEPACQLLLGWAHKDRPVFVVVFVVLCFAKTTIVLAVLCLLSLQPSN